MMISRPIGALAIGGGVLLAASKAGDGLSPSAPAGDRPVGNPSTSEGWVWPMPVWEGYKPTISDGPGNNKRDGGSRSHNGVDIDYKRRTKSDLPAFRPGTRPSGGGLYFCPDDVPILAARDGMIWSCSESDRGLQIVIDHGKPFATYYQHMRRVFFPLGTSRGRGAIRVKAGQVIGLVGNGHAPGKAAPSAFNHLHFEVWRDGGAAQWTDPTPFLARACMMLASEILLPRQ